MTARSLSIMIGIKGTIPFPKAMRRSKKGCSVGMAKVSAAMRVRFERSFVVEVFQLTGFTIGGAWSFAKEDVVDRVLMNPDSSSPAEIPDVTDS